MAVGAWRRLPCLTLPAALAGGLAAAFLTGVLSLGSLAGLLAVLGIALRNQMLLINHYRHLVRDEGEALDAAAGPARGAGTGGADLDDYVRRRPRHGPALLLGDMPGLEFIRPMAIAVLGGLVTAELLNLFSCPRSA